MKNLKQGVKKLLKSVVKLELPITLDLEGKTKEQIGEELEPALEAAEISLLNTMKQRDLINITEYDNPITNQKELVFSAIFVRDWQALRDLQIKIDGKEPTKPKTNDINLIDPNIYGE